MTEQKRGEIPGHVIYDEAPFIPDNQRATSLTGDPVDLGRGMTEEAKQKLFKEQNPHLASEDAFSVPGLDPDATVDGGVDNSNDPGCEGGACKL